MTPTKYSPAVKRGHDAVNLESARIILETREEHGPALIAWAERVIAAQKTPDLLGNCAKIEESGTRSATNAASALVALRVVPDHPKFADLKHRLGTTKGATLGYLECIWHFTAKFTPQGNIGKFRDSAIAKGGTSSECNLQTLCRRCNASKGDRTLCR